MLELCLLFIFLSVFTLVLGIMPLNWENRPTLKLNIGNNPLNIAQGEKAKHKNPLIAVLSIVRKAAYILKPLAITTVGRRMFKDLSLARAGVTVEEFFLIKMVLMTVSLWAAVSYTRESDFFLFGVLMGFAAGYMLPEMWLKARIKKIKDAILKDLPDTVDLLGLCVNAGLDFMMALKYVVDKSHPTIIVEEMRNMMQEINVGKTRRDALRDFAKRYEMPDVSTFTRTLIQADRMGTSVSEALNILSEDMRETRFRRGEAMALKAPLKMLIPLLFFIFPVVCILVAGPIFLDFMQNNPLQNLGR